MERLTTDKTKIFARESLTLMSITKDELRKLYNEIFDRLQEYEVAEETGQIIVPPCKVRQTVWLIDRRNNRKIVREGVIVNTKHMSYSTGATRFFVEVEFEYISPYYNDGRKEKTALWGIWQEWWGSWCPVYPTKEEAEQALKGGVQE